MGHEAGDVALAVADSGDIVYCAVGIAGVVSFLGSRKATDGTVGSCVAENHLAVLLEVGNRSFVAIVIAVGMRDGNSQDLVLLRAVGERSVRLLDTDVNVATNEAQAAISHHRAGEQACFAKNLEAIANAQDHAAALGEFFDGPHHRRKTRDGASAEIVAVGKSAGQNDGVAVRKIFRLVPDKFDGLPQDVADSVKSVVVTIGPGENDDSKFHVVPAPCGIAGTPILAHTRESGRERIDKKKDNAETQRARRNRREEKDATFVSWLLCVASTSSPLSLDSRRRQVHGAFSRPNQVC